MLQTVFSARSCSPFPLTLPDDAVALIAGEGGHQIRIVRPGRERVYHVSQKRYLRVLHAVVKHLGGTVMPVRPVNFQAVLTDVSGLLNHYEHRSNR
jgi:hypothetical protein